MFSDEDIERAAEALWASQVERGTLDFPWKEADEDQRDDFREDVRIVAASLSAKTVTQ